MAGEISFSPIFSISAVTGQNISVLGCVAGFVSNAFWIAYCYALRYMEKYNIDAMVFLLYQFLGATICLIPFMFAEGIHIEAVARGDVLAGLLFLGFANGLLAYGLFNYAVRVVGILIPNVINNFIPVVTIGMGVIFFHTEVNLYQYIGIFLILVSILIISMKKE